MAIRVATDKKVNKNEYGDGEQMKAEMIRSIDNDCAEKSTYNGADGDINDGQNSVWFGT